MVTLVASASLIRRVAFGCTLVVITLGLGAALVHHLGRGSSWTTLLSLSYEGNLPTWYASSLLFSCGLALAAVASRARRAAGPHAGRWALLSAVFFYISFDEAVGLHEQLNDVLQLRGLLHYGWVVPAAVVVIALGVAYLPLLRDLGPRMKRQILLAAVLYVGGALLVELPLGLWTEYAGDDNLVYALIDFLEESLELLGTTLFLSALVEHLEAQRPSLAEQAG